MNGASRWLEAVAWPAAAIAAATRPAATMRADLDIADIYPPIPLMNPVVSKQRPPDTGVYVRRGELDAPERSRARARRSAGSAARTPRRRPEADQVGAVERSRLGLPDAVIGKPCRGEEMERTPQCRVRSAFRTSYGEY